MLTTKQLDKLIDALRGSCESLENTLTSYYAIDYTDLSIEAHQYIDDFIFNCAWCGWWCEVDEMSEKLSEQETETICENCELYS